MKVRNMRVRDMTRVFPTYVAGDDGRLMLNPEISAPRCQPFRCQPHRIDVTTGRCEECGKQASLDDWQDALALSGLSFKTVKLIVDDAVRRQLPSTHLPDVQLTNGDLGNVADIQAGNLTIPNHTGAGVPEAPPPEPGDIVVKQEPEHEISGLDGGGVWAPMISDNALAAALEVLIARRHEPPSEDLARAVLEAALVPQLPKED